MQGSITELVQANKLGLGCRFKNGQVKLDAKTFNEMQIAMHISGASKSLLVCVNANNLNDFVTHETAYDPQYFEDKLGNKLNVFFENIFIREVIRQDVNVKN